MTLNNFIEIRTNSLIHTHKHSFKCVYQRIHIGIYIYIRIRLTLYVYIYIYIYICIRLFRIYRGIPQRLKVTKAG